jgi:hypothetical protein
MTPRRPQHPTCRVGSIVSDANMVYVHVKKLALLLFRALAAEDMGRARCAV